MSAATAEGVCLVNCTFFLGIFQVRLHPR